MLPDGKRKCRDMLCLVLFMAFCASREDRSRTAGHLERAAERRAPAAPRTSCEPQRCEEVKKWRISAWCPAVRAETRATLSVLGGNAVATVSGVALWLRPVEEAASTAAVLLHRSICS
jgi:hypothetical protein